MPVYEINYDLIHKTPEQHAEISNRILDSIESIANSYYNKFHTTTYFIKTNLCEEDIFNQLRPHITKDDKMSIAKISSYIGQNIPNESNIFTTILTRPYFK